MKPAAGLVLCVDYWTAPAQCLIKQVHVNGIDKLTDNNGHVITEHNAIVSMVGWQNILIVNYVKVIGND